MDKYIHIHKQLWQTKENNMNVKEIKDLKLYQELQNFDIKDFHPNFEQLNKITEDLQLICAICNDWTQSKTTDTPWDITKGSEHNKELGNICRNTSIAGQWVMIQLMKDIHANSIQEGYKNTLANHSTMSPQLWRQIENLTKTVVAEGVASFTYTRDEVLYSSAYKDKKIGAGPCWQIGNEFAEVMGVKVPHPDKGKMNSRLVTKRGSYV